MGCRLGFVAEEEADGGAGEVPVLADLVLEVAAVGFLDPLGEVAEEDEGGHLCVFEHGDVLYLDELSFVGGGREGGDVFLEHAVDLGGGDGAAAVLVYVDGGLYHLVDALFGECGAEDYGEVGEGCEALADGGFEVLDGGLRLVGGDVPFVDYHDDAFLVALDEGEYVDVLCLDASCGVDDEDAYVGCLDGAYGADDGVVLDVFVYFGLLADAGGVDEVEVESEFVVAGVDGIACGAGDVGDDVPVFADEGVDERRLAGVGAAYDCEAGYVVELFGPVGVFGGEVFDHFVEEVAGAVAVDG